MDNDMTPWYDLARNTSLLLKRLEALHKNGVLSDVALDGMKGWADRVNASLANLPPVPSPNASKKE